MLLAELAILYYWTAPGLVVSTTELRAEEGRHGAVRTVYGISQRGESRWHVEAESIGATRRCCDRDGGEWVRGAGA